MDEKKELIITQPTISQEEIKKRTQFSPSFFSMFSNQLRVAASITEFRLFFGENYPSPSGEIVIIENLSIILSPIQAKVVAKSLVDMIQQFEAKNGPIPVLQATPPAPPTAVTATAQPAISDKE